MSVRMLAPLLAVLGIAVLLLAGSRQRLRQQLADSELRLQVVEDSSAELRWESDPQGQLVYAGTLAEAYFGYPQQEITGLNLLDVVHARERDRLLDLLSAGGWSRQRFRCVGKDGSELWFEGSARAVLDARGRVRGFSGSTHRLGRDALDEDRLSAVAARIYGALDAGSLRTVLQPIVSLASGLLAGVEALSRFDGSAQGPQQWFDAAAEVGLSTELDLAAIRACLASVPALPAGTYLSLNVSPVTLRRPELLELLTSGPVAARALVVEVTENIAVADYADLAVPVRALRQAGIRLAVDDAGAGYASLRHVLRLAPSFIKLDRSLVSEVDHDPGQAALVAAMVAFAEKVGAHIIAEGIETGAELATLRELGVHAGQGYLLGRPAPVLPARYRTGASGGQRR